MAGPCFVGRNLAHLSMQPFGIENIVSHNSLRALSLFQIPCIKNSSAPGRASERDPAPAAPGRNEVEKGGALRIGGALPLLSGGTLQSICSVIGRQPMLIGETEAVIGVSCQPELMR